MDSERRRYAQGTGRNAPRLQVIPGALVIPAKAGTYPIAPTDAARPVSYFPQGHVIPAKAGTYWRSPCRVGGNLLDAPAAAQAGTYPIAPRPHRVPVRSALSRRVRGVLSPYRERGNSALTRLNGAGFPPTRE